jgi:MFS superfamily sulfate permease-like transporter
LLVADFLELESKMEKVNTAGAPPGGTRGRLAADFLASIVVFLVALPLCIGIAQACGLPPEAGLVTGIVGGLVVGFLAGSPLQVSGPAAGLIVLVVAFLDDAQKAGHTGASAVALLGLAIFLAGLLQMLAGALRLGQWFRAVSPAVVEGMLAGIGLTILAKQFHVMVDDDAPKQVLDALATIPHAIWKAFDPPAGARANHTEAAVIGLVAILILIGWKSVAPRRLKLVPAAVVAVLAAVLINEFGRPVFEGLGVQIGPAVDNHGGIGVERVQIAASLADAVRPFGWPGWEVLTLALVWKAAFTFALIASAETLLCAVAVDAKHTGPRTKFDRELAAQGLGNAICGLLGALPMTGVIVRSSANVEAGAKSRLSTILHGVWLLLFVTLLPGLIARIPLAALAAVLVYTGWKLLNLPGLRKLWAESRSEALIFVATATTIVSIDLLAGVALGVVLSALKLLIRFSHLRVAREDEPAHDRIHVYLEGAATFLRLPILAQELEAVPHGKKLHVHLDRLEFVDHAVLHLLMTFQKQYEATGGRLFIDWEKLHAHFHGPRRVRTPTDQPNEETKHVGKAEAVP